MRHQRPDLHPGERGLRASGRGRDRADPVPGARRADHEAAKKVKIIGIDSAADSKAFTSFLTTDNVKGGEVAADALAAAIKANYGKAEGEVALITSLPGVGSLDQRAKGFKEELAAKYPGLKLVADKVADGQATTGAEHHDRPDHRQSQPARRVRQQPHHGPGRRPGGRREQEAQDKIKLVGFDNDDKLVGFLKDGVIYALDRAGPVPHGL